MIDPRMVRPFWASLYVFTNGVATGNGASGDTGIAFNEPAIGRDAAGSI